jgi:hypothetical protein
MTGKTVKPGHDYTARPDRGAKILATKSLEAGGWRLRIKTLEPAGRVPPDALLFMQAPKKSKQKMAFSCGGHFLLHGVMNSIHLGLVDQSIVHLHRFTGPLPLAPALRCSAVVFRACAMASTLSVIP